jgi:hypothetical protein
MTALCGGGASQAKPGFAETITINTAGLAAALNNVPTVYAVPFAALLQAISLDLTSMCSSDPPAQPVMSPLDWAALATPPYLPGQQEARNKFAAWITYFLWFQFCECASGGTPPPVLPPPPASVPDISPTFPGYPAPIGACATLTGSGPLVASTFTNLIHLVTIPITATSMQLTCTVITAGAGPHGGAGFAWAQYAPGNSTAIASGVNPSVPAGTPYVVSIPISPLASIIDVSATPGAVANSNTVRADVVVSCNGQVAGQPAEPCCAPDASTQGLLEQLLSLVTIIQRQIVPFAYVPGAVHAGLTGDGTFLVPHIVGVQVDVTVFPPAIGHAGDDPIEYFDLGFLTLGTAEGFDHSLRMDHQHQVHFPPRASLYTKIGYQITPGATVTITELLREP